MKQVPSAFLPLGSIGLLLTWLAAPGCHPSAGLEAPALLVIVSTTGDDPDPDGYVLLVDGEPSQRLLPNTRVGLAAFSDGEHTVALAEVAANCLVAEENPQTVLMSPGNVSRVTFTVTCAKQTGALVVRVTTDGSDMDPDGYRAAIDGTELAALGLNSELALDLAPGEHVVELLDVAANCQVAGDNPRTVTVVAGASAAVDFTVSCSTLTPSVGSLRVRTVTRGRPAGGAGYTFSVDDGAPRSIGANATSTLTGIPAGSHTLTLADVAANCALEGDNPRTVDVPAGGVAEVTFRVRCTAPPPETGTLRVVTTTSGSGTDPNGFTFTVDGGAARAIEANATATVENLTPGTHAVELAGLAANCELEGDNPRIVDVPAGAVAEVTFSIRCTASPPGTGTLRVVTTTSGSDPDADGFTFTIDGGPARAIGANATVTVEHLTPGTHVVELAGVASNCTLEGDNPRTVSVPADGTTTAGLTVTCVATTGSVRVSVTTSGSPTDPDGYTVQLDGAGPGQPVATSGTATFTRVAPGARVVTLAGLAANCSDAEGARRDVTVRAGATAEVSFTIRCTATTGSLEVTVSTTGASPDADGYRVRIDDGAAHRIPTNGSVVVPDLTAGSHRVRLSDLAPNCSVQGANPRSVNVSAGTAAAVTFTVDCPRQVVLRWSSTSLSGNDVWGTDPSNAFAVSGSVVLGYDGTSWVEDLELPGAATLEGVWASGRSDVWVVGNSPGLLSSDAVIYRRGSAGWAEAERFAPGLLESRAIFHAVWGASATSVFAVGTVEDGPDRRPLVARYNGSSWSTMTLPGGDGVELLDVSGTSGSDVYAVGRRSSASGESGVVFRYDGTGWSRMLETEGAAMSGVWAASASSVFVVSADGSVRHFDGSGWLSLPVPTTEPLHAIWGSSASDLFAVGDAGVILHYDGAAWTRQTSGTTRRLLGVWGSSGTNVFAVGEGVILHGTE